MTQKHARNGSLDRLSENLRNLARHLDDIATGVRPTSQDLAEAPLLDSWEPKLTVTQAPAIRGVVFGHDSIPDGEALRADILAADPDLRWIRSWAGYYRLGCQAEKSAPALTEEGARA